MTDSTPRTRAKATDATDTVTLTGRLRWSTVVVTIVILTLSFYALYDFGRRAMGLPAELAWLVPVGIDGLTVVAIETAYLLRHRGFGVRAYVWLVLAAGVGLSMSGGHYHATALRLPEPGVIGFTIGPVVLALAVHLAVVAWRHVERPVIAARRKAERDKTLPVVSPAPVTAVSAVPPAPVTADTPAGVPGDRDAAAARLRAKGASYPDIARQLGVSQRTAIRAVKRGTPSTADPSVSPPGGTAAPTLHVAKLGDVS